MKLSSLALIPAFTLLSLSIGSAKADNITVLESTLASYNVLTFGDLGSSSNPYSSASAQGVVAVGGNAYLQSFAANSLGISGVGLTVAGNLNQQTSVDYGNVFVGGNADFHSLLAGVTLTGSLTVDGSILNSPLSFLGRPLTGTDPLNFTALQANLTNASVLLGQETATGTVSFNAATKALVLTGTNAGENVFNLSNTTLALLAGGSFALNIPTGSTALINVSGTSVNFGGSGNVTFLGSALNNPNILFNFYQATSLTVPSIDGSILAPLANVTVASGVIKGSVIADSILDAGSTGGTFNLWNFASAQLGTQIASVPEPGTWAVLLPGAAGLLAFGAYRMRRRNDKVAA